MNVCYFPSSVFMKMPYCIHVLEGQELLSLTSISEAKYKTKYKMLSVQQRERKSLEKEHFALLPQPFWTVNTLCQAGIVFTLCAFSVCTHNLISAIFQNLFVWVMSDLHPFGLYKIVNSWRLGPKCFTRSWAIRNWNSRWKGSGSSWLNSLVCPGPPAIPQITVNRRVCAMAQQEPRLKEK